MSQRIVVGVTGASGAVYSRRLLEALLEGGADVHLIVSPLGRAVAAAELGDGGLDVPAVAGKGRLAPHLHDDLFSPLASGSRPTDGMVICPCSCHTLAAIAAGLGDNLITRSAHVHLKERRPLVLFVREMPLAQIDLRNMLRVSEAGGVICPASPPFYGRPKTLDDLVDATVGRLLDLLGVPTDLAVRWPGPQDPPSPNAGLDG